MHQLRTINKIIVERDYYREFSENLQHQLTLADSLNLYYKKVIEKQESIVSLQKDKESLMIEQYESALREQKSKSRNKLLKVGIGGAVLGFIISIFLK